MAITYDCTTFAIAGGATHAAGINNSGVVVGTFTPSGSTSTQGFVRDAAGNITMVNYPGATSTQLFKINNNGVSVGTATMPGASGPVSFTVDLNGNFQTISLPVPYNQSAFTASGINDNGYVSGWVFSNWIIVSPSGDVTVADSTAFAPPGGLNNSLQLLEPNAGGSFFSTKLFQPGQSDVTIAPNNYPVPGAGNGYGTGLNNSGVIVGYQSNYHAGGFPYVPFLRDVSGAYSEIVCRQIPHFGTLPYAISDSGAITGDDTAQSPTQAFIATPLPGSAQFTATASSLTFAPQPAGGASPGQTVTITNTGNARMDIGSMEFYGYPGFAGPGFKVSGCLDPATGYASLDPGASCTITVVFIGTTPPFVPPPGTTLTDRLIIDDSGPASPHIIDVSGQVLASPPRSTPPECMPSGYSAGPPRQVTFTMADAVSGLASIVVESAVNASAIIPAFAAGDTNRINPTMTQTDPSQASSLTFQATNTAGLSTSCSAGIGTSQWTGLTGTVTGRVVVVLDSVGALEAFARGSDNSLWHTSQSDVNGPWSAWESLGGVITSDPAAIVGSDGGLKIFAAGSDSAVWEIEQTLPQGEWSNWISLGGAVVGSPAVALSGGDAIDVFARGTDLALWHRYQMGSGGPWSDWTSLGGYLIGDPVTAVTYSSAPINVFAQGGDSALWQIAETGSATEMWTDWTSVGAEPFIGRPSITPDETGLLEVFVRGTDNMLRRNVQSAPNSLTWTGWTSLGGYLTSDPAAATNQDGTLDVLARGGDNALWHIAQSSPGGSFGAWMSLGGFLGSSITALRDTNGRIEVYALAPDSTLWHIAQVFPGAWN